MKAENGDMDCLFRGISKNIRVRLRFCASQFNRQSLINKTGQSAKIILAFW